MNAVAKYLNRYAETAPPNMEEIAIDFAHCVVIPVFNETPDFVSRLTASTLWQQNILVVIVVNQPSIPITQLNQLLLQHFELWPCIWRAGFYSLYQRQGEKSACLVIDACQEPNAVHGAGAARKLGCDTAVQLWANGVIKSPWLHNTDADASLPSNYFAELPEQHAVAGCFQFEHVAADNNSSILHATQQYEQAINYYAKSLRWAGSPYAFTALGSALVVHAVAYCQVRGFPKKEGGEDFYLLNKLAKIGSIAKLPQTIQLTARTSDRVPFGTGPATQKILDLHQNNQTYCYYNPECFIALKTWLNATKSLWQNPETFNSLPLPIQQALNQLKVSSLITHIQSQNKTSAQAQTSISDWFDGFRTLKFIHFLQTHFYPALPLQGCLDNAVYLPKGPP